MKTFIIFRCGTSDCMPGSVRRTETPTLRSSSSTWPEVGIGGPEVVVSASAEAGDGGPVSGAGTVADDDRDGDARQETNDTRQITNDAVGAHSFVAYE